MATLGSFTLGKYRMDPRGIAALSQTAAIQDVALAAAEKIAQSAREIEGAGPVTASYSGGGKLSGGGAGGSYSVYPAVVPAGRRNELRGGARVVDTSGGYRGARTRALINAIAANTTGGPGQKIRYTTKSGKTIWATEAQVRNWTRGRRS